MSAGSCIAGLMNPSYPSSVVREEIYFVLTGKEVKSERDVAEYPKSRIEPDSSPQFLVVNPTLMHLVSFPEIGHLP